MGKSIEFLRPQTRRSCQTLSQTGDAKAKPKEMHQASEFQYVGFKPMVYFTYSRKPTTKRTHTQPLYTQKRPFYLQTQLMGYLPSIFMIIRNRQENYWIGLDRTKSRRYGASQNSCIKFHPRGLKPPLQANSMLRVMARGDREMKPAHAGNVESCLRLTSAIHENGKMWCSIGEAYPQLSRC